MRLLFLTNFYPPARQGGYEFWCQETAEGLRKKKHEVVVLTSKEANPDSQLQECDWIHRKLNLEMAFQDYVNVWRFFFQRQKLEEENGRIVAQVLQELRPDGVCVWGMWNLNRSILPIVESALPGRVVYYIGDYWPFLPSQYEMYWETPAKNWLTWLPKKLLSPFARRMLNQASPPALRFEHVLFPSRFMQRDFLMKGLQPIHSQVVYGAVPTQEYARDRKNGKIGGPLRLLFVGRLEHDKGVHTAVQAAAVLIKRFRFLDFTLTIVGSGDPHYTRFLHRLAAENHLERHVVFHGSAPKEQMPAVYRGADVFLFTSIWQEPFGRVLVEAMAAGLVVIGTATGGSAEILVDGKTGLTYPPDDAEALAERIFYLASHPERYAELQNEGRRFALENFSTERMVDEIEAYFLNLIAGSA